MTYSTTDFLITYTANGVTYTLNGYDATTGLTILYGGDAGWGLPPIQAIVERGALQNGDTPVDYRFDARTITLNLFVEAYNYIDHLAIREKLSKIFAVSNSEGVLNITYSYTPVPPPGVSPLTYTFQRSIDVLVRGGLQFGSFEYNDYNVDATVELRASDPMWYDPNALGLQVTQTVAGTATPIPLIYPVTFGGLGINQTTTLAYNGTAVEYPMLTITVGDPSDITNLYIINETTGKTLYFPTLYAGRTYTVNLTYGYKTIVNDLGENSIGLLSVASNLATWAIDPSVGENVITVQANTSNSTSVVEMTYYVRYNTV